MARYLSDSIESKPRRINTSERRCTQRKRSWLPLQDCGAVDTHRSGQASRITPLDNALGVIMQTIDERPFGQNAGSGHVALDNIVIAF